MFKTFVKFLHGAETTLWRVSFCLKAVQHPFVPELLSQQKPFPPFAIAHALVPVLDYSAWGGHQAKKNKEKLLFPTSYSFL